MNERETLKRVRAYVEENLLYMRADFHLEDEVSLFEAGVVDSMGVMELISFLEEEFDLRVADREITEENLGSLRSIARYVSSKTKTREVA